MSTETITLLTTTSTVGSFTGPKKEGAGYHNRSNNLHTFVVVFNSWSGELKFQGTLSLYPNDDTDWVNLRDQTDQEIVFGDGSTDYDDAYTVNSVGNFVWVRAVGTVSSGEITEIRYNL